MNNFIIETKGFAELYKTLKQMPEKMQQECTENALKAGGKEIIPAIKRNIISHTGGLRESISQRTNRKQGTNCLVQIGTFLPTAKYYSKGGKFRFVKPWYSHMVEWGTKAHNAQASVFARIQASKPGAKKRMMRFRPWNRGSWVTKEAIRGITPQRPFTRGFDEKKMAFLWQYGEYVNKYITKYFKKNAPNITR